VTDPNAELASVTDWAEGLSQPYDDAPYFEPETSTEVDSTIRLQEDERLERTPTRRLFRDYRANAAAYKHLDPLPEPGTDLEMLISGKYAMWDLVPALIEHLGPIEHLHIATLSFSKQNAGDILGLLDSGDIKRISLVISYYYKSTSREIYDLLVPNLIERGHRVKAIRNHAKIILAEMVSGDRFNIRGSPNLRSSVNIERLTLSRGDDVYNFDKAWLEDVLERGKELGT
jgi:hypothetical protein